MSKLIGLVLLLTVGVGFYITLFTVVLRYEETAEQYFIDHAYADITIHGVFDDGDVSFISGLDGVILARGRNVRDFREGERIFRAISLTDGINIPYIYEGRPPQNKSEIMLLNRNANAMGLHLGDTLTLGNRNLLITGLAASPEYIYLVQSERNPMAQAGSFGVIFVTAEFFGEGYNEIVALTNGNVIPEGFNVITRGDQANYNLYREDLSQIRSFAFIFPLVFAVLISVVIYVTLSRTIQKDRRKIGIMKALGVFDEKIIVMYLTRFCVAALVGAFLGGVGAIVLSDFIIGIFSSMFEVPTLSFVFYPVLWLSAFVIAVLLCVVSGLVALFPILSLLPAHAMRPRIPKGGSRLPIEQTFLWKRLSFNTRYALKNSFRNKGRFFAVILGMCGSCALLVFSLGFYDSIINTRDRYFNEFANYDVIISFDPMPLSVPHPALESLDESQKALVMPVEILGSNYILAIVDYDFDMLNIPREALQNGVIIPKFFAEKWDTGVGEILQINDHKAEISAVIPQYLGLMLFVGGTPPMYNTIYGRSTDMAALTTFLIENNISFSTIDDDKTSFYSVMESMSVLILFMIACSVILGFTVLYSVGMINLSAREYEYMFMGVMGYPHSKILAAHIKETVVQLVLAIPLGFILGYFLLESIKDVFSGEAFVISAAIFPRSYFIAALKVIGVTALMGFITSRHIKKLDIVEGLKAIDTV
ncbi:MAG: ABC transporter permease [Defluviitaleaceae bacterium]|nr:ABC transporter permease [Defluviitaleaceae bacterium]